VQLKNMFVTHTIKLSVIMVTYHNRGYRLATELYS